MFRYLQSAMSLRYKSWSGMTTVRASLSLQTLPSPFFCVARLIFPLAAAFVVDDGNVTRPATPDEIAENLSLQSCADDACTEERELLRRQAVDDRKEIEFMREHGQEVQSMMIAGIRQPVDVVFGESEMVVTDEAPMWESTPWTGAPQPVRTPTVSVPTASIGGAMPEVTGRV